MKEFLAIKKQKHRALMKAQKKVASLSKLFHDNSIHRRNYFSNVDNPKELVSPPNIFIYKS